MKILVHFIGGVVIGLVAVVLIFILAIELNAIQTAVLIGGLSCTTTIVNALAAEVLKKIKPVEE